MTLDIEITCFGYDGIDAIKAALKAGEAIKTSDVQPKIKLVAPPLYSIFAHALDRQQGIEVMEKAVAVIIEEIRQRGGDLIVKMAVRSSNHTLMMCPLNVSLSSRKPLPSPTRLRGAKWSKRPSVRMPRFQATKRTAMKREFLLPKR